MKRYVAAFIVLVIHAVSSNAEDRPGRKWKEYFADEHYHAYYDTESIKSFQSGGDRMARIWSGEVQAEEVKKKAWRDLNKNVALWEYNCTKKTVALIKFLAEGEVVGGDSSLMIAPSHIDIEAESQYESLYNIACDKAPDGENKQ